MIAHFFSALIYSGHFRESLVDQIAASEKRVGDLQDRRNAPSSPEAAVAELRLRLARELSIHTDEHPNVISLRRRIELLNDEVSEISQLSTSTSDTTDREHQAAVRDREELRQQLVETEAEIRAIDARIDLIPERTNDLTALDERAAVMRATYLDFMHKVQDAELAEQLESAQQGPRVTLLDRAQVPGGPLRPPIMYVIPGILGSFALMLALGVGLEVLDPVVLNANHLEAIGAPPLLGAIHRTT